MKPSLILTSILLMLTACTGQRLAPAPPVDLHERAVPVGFEQSHRFFGDVSPDNVDVMLATIREQIADRIRLEGEIPNGGAVDVLTLSGGGSDGAYGAGLLNGWSHRGGRPEFQLITGISTGALIAPFAFLGSSRDCELRELYTNLSTEDLLITQVFSALTGDSLGLSGSSALADRIDLVLDEKTLDAIAAEHRKGRRLWIGTTNLDAQRPIVWDIGSIADSGNPRRRALIRDVLLASSSIPGVFAPVQIAVEVDGQRFAEMHMDGGVTRQIFFLPVQLKLNGPLVRANRRIKPGTIYALRNTKLDPDYAEVTPRVVEITSRAVSTLIKAAGVADILVIESQARENGFGLRVTSVPSAFNMPETEFFDPVYMKALFDTGYQLAAEGDPWNEIVPPAAVPFQASRERPVAATCG